MENIVPALSIVMMAVVALFGVAIPVVLFLVFRRKRGADVLPFFIGCAVFILFALVVEGTLNSLILNSALGKKIMSNVWLYAVFGGMMAGLFEETGRYTAFKTVLRKKRGNDANALMYGAGHGGFEALYILGISMVTYIVMALNQNAGVNGTEVSATVQGLIDTPPATYLLAVVERFAAVAFHIAASVLVWFAAKNAKRFWLYPLAVLLHALFDAVAIVLANYISSTVLLECIIVVYAALCVLLAAAVWKKNASAGETAADAPAEPAQ